jgi:hypothetical protein
LLPFSFSYSSSVLRKLSNHGDWLITMVMDAAFFAVVADRGGAMRKSAAAPLPAATWRRVTPRLNLIWTSSLSARPWPVLRSRRQQNRISPFLQRAFDACDCVLDLWLGLRAIWPLTPSRSDVTVIATKCCRCSAEGIKSSGSLMLWSMSAGRDRDQLRQGRYVLALRRADLFGHNEASPSILIASESTRA